MLILYLLEDEQGLRVRVLLALYIDEIIASFYMFFRWIWALTMSFTNIYHRLLWILQYFFGIALYLIFAGFKAYFCKSTIDLPWEKEDLGESLILEDDK